MSVKAIPNRAEVKGRLTELHPHPELTGYVVATVDVAETAAVPGFANLLDWTVGQAIRVNVTDAQARALTPGLYVACKARVAGPQQVFADADTPIRSGDRDEILSRD